MEDDLDRRVSEARAYAREQVDACGLFDEATGEWGAEEIYVWMKADLHVVDGPRSSYIDGNLNLMSPLCDLANTDSECRTLASQTVATRILNDQPLTDDLKTFAYQSLMGHLPKVKTKRGRKPNHIRDLFLIMILNELKAKFDLRPTHNDEKSDNSPPSGAEILSECFCSIGRREVTPRALKDLWLNAKKRDWVNSIEELILPFR